MKIKKTKIIFLIIFLGFLYPSHSFSEIIKQKNTTDENSHFNMFLDFSSSINSTVKKEFSEGSRFSEDYLNLEVIGKATDKISYRFTKQFKKTENFEMIDLAYLKYKWNDKLYFLVGKQPFSFGSMEYANNFYEHAYRYPHVYKNKENSVGFSFIYLPIKDHEFQFQIINGIKNKEVNVVQIKNHEVNHPMGYSVNWNWSLLNNNKKIIQNRWSYSIFQENEKKKFWKLLALGSKLNWKPFSIEADYIFSDEDIEKNGEVTKILRSLNNDYSHIASVKYGTYLVKLKYNFIPKWNLIAKGVYEIGTSKEGINDILGENQLFQKTYTYYGGVEFLPIIKNDDLSFHLSYQNQRVNYSLDQMKKENNNNHFIILGLSYRVKMI
ncbi:porin [Blattabacterium cuenoti]|uniref:porin n=1 Tax=Blattabacterium cuenoti TaxID=1653831 RepID=UPI001EEAF5D5|nr:porin [Blattabacterium cuenoti]